jgi:hypothetical protein
MHTILDLDLDFFVWPPFRGRPEEARLPRCEWKRLASEDEVRSFLEKRCHLSREAPVMGYEAEQHQDAFNVWRQWVEDETIIAPFSVAHADAHSATWARAGPIAVAASSRQSCSHSRSKNEGTLRSDQAT